MGEMNRLTLDLTAIADAVGHPGPYAIGVVQCELCRRIDVALRPFNPLVPERLLDGIECSRCGQLQSLFVCFEEGRRP